MPVRSRSFLALLPMAAAALVASALATESRAEPDPLQLLRDAAAAVDEAPSASVDFSVGVKVVMGEQSQQSDVTFNYQKSGERFRFAPEADEQGAVSEGIVVAGNGAVTVTHLVSRGQHTLEEGDEGFVGFTQSPLAAGIGNGLGGLALSFLDPNAMSQLVALVTESEYLGVEAIDGVDCHHLRCTVEDAIVFEAWIDAGDKPLARRVKPDLSDMMANSAAARQHDNFEYSITFDYTDWSTEAAADALQLSEPSGSTLVESFFGSAQEAPHPLLGEPAPAVELGNLGGQSVNLADHFGKEVVLLDFWATWCGPCVQALPKVTELAEGLAENGVVFYAVNQQDDPATVEAFLQQQGLDTPVLLDPESAAANAYSVENLPTSVLVGKDGRVQAVHIGIGPNFAAELKHQLEALVAGEDLAAEKVAAKREAAQKRQQMVERLRSKLDG